jgi:capsular polysaccharide transport system ATP-binding protein
MIIIRNLFHVSLKEAEKVIVFDDLSADLPTDRAFGILGLEDSGKTTLMRLLSGFLKPQAGEITRYSRLSFPIGYDGIFKRSISPRDNLMRFAQPFGRQIEEIIRYVSAKTAMGAGFDMPLGKLSQEMQQRFVFVATYALPFDCYLIDERFAPNEPDFKSTCVGMLEQRLKEAGAIIATKRPSLVKRFCTSAAVLAQGKLTIYNETAAAIEAFKDLEVRAAASKLASAAPLAFPAR